MATDFTQLLESKQVTDLRLGLDQDARQVIVPKT